VHGAGAALNEPVTLLTDYLLAGLCAFLGTRLLSAEPRNAPRMLWGASFLALAVGAFLGGTFHGFRADLGTEAKSILWNATLLAVGAFNCGMLAGSALACLPPRFGRIVAWLCVVKFGVYAFLAIGTGAFFPVIVDSGATMALMALFHLPSAWRGDAASRWALAALALSVVAAIVQAAKLAPHPQFNHNDLYHVIQAGAMYLFYRAALARKTAPSTS
jgi:hypothetical protein